MARPYERCVVAVSVDEDATWQEFFVYGATAQELTEDPDQWVYKMIAKRYPGVSEFLVGIYDYEPKYELPRSLVPIVYSVGRRAPEFV
jgi:hypothetical protein